MIRRFMSLFGFTIADMLMLLGFASIVWVLVLPTLQSRESSDQLEAVLADVATLRSAAIGHRESTGAWPVHTEPGVIPEGLFGAFPADTALVRENYTMQWASFEVVDMEQAAPGPADPEAPPEADAPEGDATPTVPVVRRVGGIVVRTTDPHILGELTARYGTDDSFARDGAWTLILPERSESR